jgi:hypothetical protein
MVTYAVARQEAPPLQLVVQVARRPTPRERVGWEVRRRRPPAPAGCVTVAFVALVRGWFASGRLGCVPRVLPSGAERASEAAQQVRSQALVAGVVARHHQLCARADKSVATSDSDETAQVVVVVVSIIPCPDLSSSVI